MIITNTARRLAAATCFSLALPALAFSQSAPSSQLYRYDGNTGDHLGSAVAQLGDIDGDHHADYAIGAEGANNWRGQVRVISGSRGIVLYTIDGVTAGDRFGHALAAMPDLDNDGKPELIVGAPLASGTTSGCGLVYVRSGRTGSALFVRPGAGAQDHMGWSVACVGDVNADGIADWAGGAIDDDDFGISCGSVRVWSGANSGALFTVFGSAAKQLLGSSLVGVGDQNNDGVSDFAVGAPSNSGSSSTGFVRIYSGFDHSVIRTLNGLNSGDNFGFAIAPIGDLDNDGRTDLAIGSPQISPASTGQLDVYLAAGGAPLFRRFGIGIADRFGASVSSAGDVDLDGVLDFVVGAPGADLPTAVDTGTLTFFSGANGSTLFTNYGTDIGMPVGASICGASDVNEDGRPEIMIGSPGNLAVASDPGSAVLLSTSPLSLWSDRFQISAAQPVPAAMAIDVGPAYAGMDYRVLGSITGMGPMTPIGGMQVPLVDDRYLKYTRITLDNFVVQSGIGQLDANGRAQLSFMPTSILQSPQYYGLTFYHVALVSDAQGQAVIASNSVPVTLVP